MKQEFPDAFWTEKRKDALRLGYMLGLDPHKLAEEIGCSWESIVAQATIMNLKRKRYASKRA